MGFQQGLSGLNAAARNLDVIGNNVANSNTIGFKGSQALFADVFANAIGGSGGSGAGIGVSVSGIQAEFSQGNITTTNSPLDMAINGNGFFRLDTNGTITYSRNGQFHLDKDGYIVNATGAEADRLRRQRPGAGGAVESRPAADCRTPTSRRSRRRMSEMVLNLDSREAAITAAVQHQRLDDLQQGVVDDRLRQPRQPALDRHLLRQDRTGHLDRLRRGRRHAVRGRAWARSPSRATAPSTPRRRRCRSTCRWR